MVDPVSWLLQEVRVVARALAHLLRLFFFFCRAPAVQQHSYSFWYVHGRFAFDGFGGEETHLLRKAETTDWEKTESVN